MAGEAGAGSLPSQIEQATIFSGKNRPKVEFPRTFSNAKGPQAGKIQGSWARHPRAAARHSPAGKEKPFFAPRGPTPTCAREGHPSRARGQGGTTATRLSPHFPAAAPSAFWRQFSKP